MGAKVHPTQCWHMVIGALYIPTTRRKNECQGKFQQRIIELSLMMIDSERFQHNIIVRNLNIKALLERI